MCGTLPTRHNLLNLWFSCLLYSVSPVGWADGVSVGLEAIWTDDRRLMGYIFNTTLLYEQGDIVKSVRTWVQNNLSDICYFTRGKEFIEAKFIILY